MCPKDLFQSLRKLTARLHFEYGGTRTCPTFKAYACPSRVQLQNSKGLRRMRQHLNGLVKYREGHVSNSYGLHIKG